MLEEFFAFVRDASLWQQLIAVAACPLACIFVLAVLKDLPARYPRSGSMVRVGLSLALGVLAGPVVLIFLHQREVAVPALTWVFLGLFTACMAAALSLARRK